MRLKSYSIFSLGSSFWATHFIWQYTIIIVSSVALMSCQSQMNNWSLQSVCLCVCLPCGCPKAWPGHWGPWCGRLCSLDPPSGCNSRTGCLTGADRRSPTAACSLQWKQGSSEWVLTKLFSVLTKLHKSSIVLCCFHTVLSGKSLNLEHPQQLKCHIIKLHT